MMKPRFFATTSAVAVGLTVITGASASVPTTSLQLQSSPKQLVDEVWQILNQNYVDGSFNHQDWNAIRHQYLNRTYTSKEEAYKAIKEMVGTLGDRYTQFFDPQAYKSLSTEISGNLSGVGIELAEAKETKAVTVVAPIEGSPAAAAGILPGDVIVKVDGHATRGETVEDVVKKIKGPVGTPVTLTVQRNTKEMSFKLTRANIDLTPVSYHTETTTAGKIGYVRLPEFTEKSPDAMRRAVQALERQNVQGYVLDLRADPGGLLDASVKIASLWLDQKPVVSLVNRKQVKERYESEGQPLTKKPLVVLVDHGSASASEILAGALQDNGRAILVGTQTFGKGVVQAIQPLEDDCAIKVTIAKYYTPKGRDINHVGIAPNVVVGLSEAQQKALVEKHQVGTPADPQFAKALASVTQLVQQAKTGNASGQITGLTTK